jgi:dienelactone hydrolase
MNPDHLFGHTILASLALTLAATNMFADPAAAGAPEQVSANPWDAAAFKYNKPAPLIVEATTPTRAQVDWHQQPPKLPAATPAPIATATPVKPYSADDFNIVRLRFRDLHGDDVPMLLSTPKDKKGPFPVVIAVHGLRSNKAQVTAQVAPALVKQGFAVLAPDMPLHGERPGEPAKMFERTDFKAFVARMHQSIVDVRLCMDVAESRPELDTSHGMILVGYSMGSVFDAVAGPADPRVKAMCLMVGGTIDFPPIFTMVPQLAAIQPQLAIAHFAGPILMLNATGDHIITREMADRLYAAAPDPKKQVWYDSGHLLPREAYEQCADWVASTWKTVAK